MGLEPLKRDPRKFPQPVCQRKVPLESTDPESRLSPDTNTASTLLLGFQPPNGNKCLLSVLCLVCSILLQQPDQVILCYSSHQTRTHQCHGCSEHSLPEARPQRRGFQPWLHITITWDFFFFFKPCPDRFPGTVKPEPARVGPKNH